MWRGNESASNVGLQTCYFLSLVFVIKLLGREAEGFLLSNTVQITACLQAPVQFTVTFHPEVPLNNLCSVWPSWHLQSRGAVGELLKDATPEAWDTSRSKHLWSLLKVHIRNTKFIYTRVYDFAVNLINHKWTWINKNYNQSENNWKTVDHKTSVWTAIQIQPLWKCSENMGKQQVQTNVHKKLVKLAVNEMI